MTSDIHAKRKPSDWRRAADISARPRGEDGWAVDFIGDRRSNVKWPKERLILRSPSCRPGV